MPTWLAFLARVQPDPAIRTFLQRSIGYSLTGLVSEQVFWFLYGTGANGKSVFSGTIAALAGRLRHEGAGGDADAQERRLESRKR